MSPLLDLAEDLESRGVRKLAAAVVARALDDARRGDQAARQWLQTGSAPGGCGWWLGLAGLRPERAERLLEARNQPKRPRQRRQAQASKSARLRGQATA